MGFGRGSVYPVAGCKAHYLAPDLAPPGPVVKIEQHDLLPGAQLEPPLVDGDAQARA